MQITWESDEERDAFIQAACSFGVQVQRGMNESSRARKPRRHKLVGHAVSAQNKGDIFLAMLPDDIEEPIRHGIHHPDESESNKNDP